MATIQIRNLSKKQREILDAFKENQSIKTDSGAIAQMIEQFADFKREYQETFDKWRQTLKELDQLKYKAIQVTLSHDNFIASLVDLDQELNGEPGTLKARKGGQNG